VLPGSLDLTLLQSILEKGEGGADPKADPHLVVEVPLEGKTVADIHALLLLHRLHRDIPIAHQGL
jgi:hypothetical protein